MSGRSDFLASAFRVVGWIVVAFGAVLTVGLAVVGGLVGFGAGTLLGGVGGVPASAAGALAGASLGLKVLGAGFTLVSVGDFLDVVADWGEGKIDGQELVQKGALELGLAITSFLGAGALGKIFQRTVTHLPASWRSRFEGLFRHDPPSSGGRADAEPGAASGSGGTRTPSNTAGSSYGFATSGSGRYRLADGSPHDTRYGPGQALRTNAQDVIDGRLNDPDLFARHGEPQWTRQDLVDVALTPVDDLTASQRAVLREIADSLPPPRAGDPVSKVLLPQDFERLVNKGQTTIKGSVSRIEDVAHLDSVAKLHDGLRLDYGASSPFKATDDAYQVLRFPAPDDTKVSRFSSLGGDGATDGWNEPYTGNGFLKSEDLIPEYRLPESNLADGAEIWEVTANGTQRLAAVLVRGRWVSTP